MRQKQYKNRSVKDCRVGRKSCALPAMTRLIGFAGKRNNFRNETFERRCGATPRKKRPHKTKNVCFPNKNAPFWCHCEAAAWPWQSLSQRYGIPWRSTGARSKKEALSQKMDLLRRFASSLFLSRFCFVPRNHSSFRDGKSFRQRLPRRAQKLRPPRNDTKLAGLMKKPASFLIGMFESVAERHRPYLLTDFDDSGLSGQSEK